MKYFLLLAVFFIGANSFAQAKIKFDSMTLDYGEIEQGSNGLRSLKFKNIGDEPLKITKVNSSCGCTVPEKPEGAIAPGDTDEIKVKYDTGRVGPIRKTITVYTNGDPEIVPIKVKGRVLENEKN